MGHCGLSLCELWFRYGEWILTMHALALAAYADRQVKCSILTICWLRSTICGWTDCLCRPSCACCGWLFLDHWYYVTRALMSCSLADLPLHIVLSTMSLCCSLMSRSLCWEASTACCTLSQLSSLIAQSHLRLSPLQFQQHTKLLCSFIYMLIRVLVVAKSKLHN